MSSGIRSSVRPAQRGFGFLPAALAGVSLLAMQSGAAAADDDNTAVVVKGHAPKASSNKYVAPLVDTPQTITVVDSKLLQQQNLLGLRDVLSTLPGITFGAGEGGGGYGDSINLRGFSANNDITVDGVRDSAQYSRTDPFNLQQVEVINGANSVYGGAGSIGGSINLVTKQPIGANLATAAAALGTDGYERLTADVNRMIGDDTAVRLNVMGHRNDVPGRDVEKYERWGVAPAVTFGLGTPTELTLLFAHQQDHNTPRYGVPYALNAYNHGPLPGVSTEDYFGYSNVDKQNVTYDSFSAIFDHRFNDHLSMRNLARWENVKQQTVVDPPQGTFCLDSGINPYTGASCSSLGTYQPSGPRGNVRSTKNQILADQMDFTLNFNTGWVKHTAVAGLSISNETYHLDTGNVERNALGATPNPTLPLMDLSDPNSVYTGPYNFIRTGFTDSEVNNRAVYLFERAEFGKHWELNGGVRYERNEGHATVATVAVPYPAPPASPTITVNAPADNNNDLVSYRVGLVYKPTESSSLYFAYSNSLTPSQSTVNGGCTSVSTTGTLNCNLDPQKSRMYEFGAKWNALNGALALTASIFRNDRTNFGVASGDPLVPQQQLDGASRVDGVALGASGQITDKWSVFANYTYLDSKILQNISDIAIAGGALDFQKGDPLPTTPKHSGGIWTTYQLPHHVMIGYGATYTGRYTFNRFNSSSPLFYTPSYWVHRAMISYELNEHATIQLNVNNLFDEKYYTNIRNNATSGWATPGDARNAVVSLNYKF